MLVSRGGVAPFDGDLDDYQRYLLDEAKRQREEIKQGVAAAERGGAGKRGLTAVKPATTRGAKKSDLQQLEGRMAVLNGEGAALESHLSTAVRPSEIAEFGKRLKVVNDELKQLEDQWLNLSTRLEPAGA